MVHPIQCEVAVCADITTSASFSRSASSATMTGRPDCSAARALLTSAFTPLAKRMLGVREHERIRSAVDCWVEWASRFPRICDRTYLSIY